MSTGWHHSIADQNLTEYNIRQQSALMLESLCSGMLLHTQLLAAIILHATHMIVL